MVKKAKAVRKVAGLTFREDLYPRIEKDPELVQKYAADLEVLPPIEVNQRGEIIDGWHRWTAHKKEKVKDIAVLVTKTASDAELLALAIRRNSKHGKQLSDGDKSKCAIRLYNGSEGLEKTAVANVLSVTLRMVNNYLHDIDKQLREARKQKIFAMWLSCHTQEEIAEAVEMDQRSIGREIEELGILETFPKRLKLAAQFQDAEFETPIYNVWAFAKSTNKIKHHGESEQRILENLLYLYTQPFDIVVDPFAGGGSTIDVCKKRLRRYWVADRLPIEEREDIRQYDILTGPPPLMRRWSEVRLTYLDPPYWKQAEGKYSKDAEDLANMPLEKFTATLVKFIGDLAKKQSQGVIALLMQPTQWNAPKHQWTDHVIDIVSGLKNNRLVLENRVSCPYSSEQCNAQMVEYAKEHKMLLGLSRELIIWKFK